ncbi:DUF1275 domain-containing protein [bacterium]|nr:DUF1275 domain-containing protein [bacterium]
MFKHDLKSNQYKKVYFNASLLSILAGCVNAGGFMASGRFVTHVTGFATWFGMDLIQNKWLAAFGTLSVPLFFLLGTMLSAFLVDRRILMGKKPAYTLVMVLITLCLLTVAIEGYFNFFGIFGGEVNIKQHYVLLILLCGASGLQNAAITTFYGAQVRTTHLTGITTDLGIGLVRLFSPQPDIEKHQGEIRANILRLLVIVSFVMGSIAGAYLFLKLQYLGFLIPALLSAYAAFESKLKN